MWIIKLVNIEAGNFNSLLIGLHMVLPELIQPPTSSLMHFKRELHIRVYNTTPAVSFRRLKRDENI